MTRHRKDTTMTRIAVWILGAALLTCVVGIIALSMQEGGRPIPDVLQNLAVGSLAALVGVLAPTRPTP